MEQHIGISKLFTWSADDAFFQLRQFTHFPLIFTEDIKSSKILRKLGFEALWFRQEATQKIQFKPASGAQMTGLSPFQI